MRSGDSLTQRVPLFSARELSQYSDPVAGSHGEPQQGGSKRSAHASDAEASLDVGAVFVMFSCSSGLGFRLLERVERPG